MNHALAVSYKTCTGPICGLTDMTLDKKPFVTYVVS